MLTLEIEFFAGTDLKEMTKAVSYLLEKGTFLPFANFVKTNKVNDEWVTAYKEGKPCSVQSNFNGITVTWKVKGSKVTPPEKVWEQYMKGLRQHDREYRKSKEHKEFQKKQRNFLRRKTMIFPTNVVLGAMTGILQEGTEVWQVKEVYNFLNKNGANLSTKGVQKYLLHFLSERIPKDITKTNLRVPTIQESLFGAKLNNWSGGAEGIEETIPQIRDCTHLESYDNGKNELCYYKDGEPIYSGVSVVKTMPTGVYPINPTMFDYE